MLLLGAQLFPFALSSQQMGKKIEVIKIPTEVVGGDVEVTSSL